VIVHLDETAKYTSVYPIEIPIEIYSFSCTGVVFENSETYSATIVITDVDTGVVIKNQSK